MAESRRSHPRWDTDGTTHPDTTPARGCPFWNGSNTGEDHAGGSQDPMALSRWAAMSDRLPPR
jgi:hypothetical protein